MAMRMNYTKASPDVFKAMMALEKTVVASGLEPSLLDLVKTRASQINGCAFCIDMHTHEALQRGEQPHRLFLLDAWREADAFTARERAALAWTEALTRLPDHGVTDELFEALRAEFSDKEIADLTLAIASINAWNRFGVGFSLEPASVAEAKHAAPTA